MLAGPQSQLSYQIGLSVPRLFTCHHVAWLHLSDSSLGEFQESAQVMQKLLRERGYGPLADHLRDAVTTSRSTFMDRRHRSWVHVHQILPSLWQTAPVELVRVLADVALRVCPDAVADAHRGLAYPPEHELFVKRMGAELERTRRRESGRALYWRDVVRVFCLRAPALLYPFGSQEEQQQAGRSLLSVVLKLTHGLQVKYWIYEGAGGPAPRCDYVSMDVMRHVVVEHSPVLRHLASWAEETVAECVRQQRPDNVWFLLGLLVGLLDAGHDTWLPWGIFAMPEMLGEGATPLRQCRTMLCPRWGWVKLRDGVLDGIERLQLSEFVRKAAITEPSPAA